MLIDGYGRKVDYLRISVTERCNFRCQYCMPEKPFSWVPKENLLSFEELFLFVQLGIDEGIKKIRITGGEPLIREGIDHFIQMIHAYNPAIDLALTTNGYFLKELAEKLVLSGLKRVNISLDSLKPDIAAQIAQKDILSDVLKGIEEAKRVGLKVKINMVPLFGINDCEIMNILEYGIHNGYTVRFIEFMENHHASKIIRGIESQEILNIIAQKYHFEKIDQEMQSPAQYYKLDSGYQFGIIEPHKDDFCLNCNRIRLTADGLLIPCLYFEDALSIKQSLKNNNLQEALAITKRVLFNKPEKNKWSDSDNQFSSRAFYETGG